MTRSVSVVLPAFNAAADVGASVTALVQFFRDEELAGSVVVVDDGSTDGTSQAVPDVHGVSVVRLESNRGKGAAVRAGMQSTPPADVKLFTDADLPYGTDPIRTAIAYVCRRGFHAVVGDRTLPGSSYRHEGLLRRSVSEVASFTFRTMVTGGIYDTQCGFKAFRGDVADELFRIARVDGFAIDVELIYLLLKHRLDIKRIPVQLRRNAGSSVHVIRDSVRAGTDVLRVRVRWARGGYDSQRLRAILAEESTLPS